MDDFTDEDDSNIIDQSNTSIPSILEKQDVINFFRKLATITNDQSTFHGLLKLCLSKKYRSNREIDNILQSFVFPTSVDKRSLVEITHQLPVLSKIADSPIFNYLSLKRIKLLENCMNPVTHYNLHFDEMGMLGRGSFGSVYRARHKVDSEVYAVKKMRLMSPSVEMLQIFINEAKIIAKLNHPNVIDYKSAWFEHFREFDEDCNQDDDDVQAELSDDFNSTDTSSGGIYFQDSHEKTCDSCLEKSRKSMDSSSDVLCLCPPKIVKKKKKVWTILYIQMALCESTLKKYIFNRNEMINKSRLALATQEDIVNEKNIVKDILVQVLKGLEYIHSQGIIHHDVKPANIFKRNQNGRDVYLLGDFGLSCSKQKPKHDSLIGTLQYSAPEQLNYQCTNKSDLYSLGLVLLELVQVFQTRMEADHAFSKLKYDGILDTRITEGWPGLCPIIKRLVKQNPDERPEASKLLSELKEESLVTLRDMQEKLAEKDEQLEEMNRLAVEKEECIRILSQEIRNLREFILRKNIQNVSSTISG